MKQLYLLLIAALVLFAAVLPSNASAQCSCPGGDPISSEVHNVYLDSVTLFFTTVNFPKFDPATGMLTCVNIEANVLTVSTLRIANREAFPTDYELDYSRNSILTGPSISSLQSATRHYGPYTLDAVPNPDTVKYIGPDTLFNNSIQSKATSNTVPYTGVSGTVSFSYGNTYGYSWFQGSNNAGLDIATFSRVNLTLTYYYCPNAVLRSNIKTISVIRKDKNVQIAWLTENEVPTNNYIVEYSRNGTDFKPAGTLSASANQVANYQYTFNGATENGRVFFRIKQIDGRGKVRYSAVKSVSFNENGVLNPVVFPNPAKRMVYVQFESTQTGTLQIELMNVAGQILENSRISANKLTNLQLNFAREYSTGMYWLRVRNQNTGEQSVTRVTIK